MTLFNPLSMNYIPKNFRYGVEQYNRETMNYCPICYLCKSDVVNMWTDEPGSIDLNEYQVVGVFCFYYQGPEEHSFKEVKKWDFVEKRFNDFFDDSVLWQTKQLRNETKGECDNLGIKYLSNKQQIEALEKACSRWATKSYEEEGKESLKLMSEVWEETKNQLPTITLRQINFMPIESKSTPAIIEINFLKDFNKNVYNYKCNQKQGEIEIMKTVNGKNKTERMVNKPLKYMGLTVEESNSNKHMYATIKEGDFDKYAYFVVYEDPHSFSQTLPSGKTITKYVFHIDNYDDGKGHDGIFVPSWMCLNLVDGDVTNSAGYFIAFERNQWNMKVIDALQKLDAGKDSIEYITPELLKKNEYKYHY